MPVDVAKALDLRTNHGLSYAKIAAIQGVCPEAIHKKIAHILPDQITTLYQSQTSDILDTVAVKILSQVDARRLKAMSGKDAMIAYGIAYDKSRLERGLATERIDHVHLSAKLEDLQKERERLSALLQVRKGVSLGVSCNGDDGK